MNLPGSQPIAAYKQQAAQSSPTQEVQRFDNQRLGGIRAGTSAQVGPVAVRGAQDRAVALDAPQTTAFRTNSAVRENSQKLLQTALIARTQRRKAAAEEAQRQAAAQANRTARPISLMQGGGGGGGGYTPGNGTAENRIKGMLGNFPGLHITETLGNRAYDVAHGVDRVPGSYHYDAANPAVDIAGPTSQLHRLYQELVASGNWRQILWQVPGHYDHIHVA